MALIKCKECGNEISTTAKACPKCGAKIKKTSIIAAILWSVIFFFIAIFILGQFGPSAPPRTADQQENSTRYAAVQSAKAAIQANLRNPDTVQWDSAFVNKDASTVCVKYRAQNGFGGMSGEFFIVAAGNISQSPAVWNKKCTKNMFDMSYVLGLSR